MRKPILISGGILVIAAFFVFRFISPDETASSGNGAEEKDERTPGASSAPSANEIRQQPFMEAFLEESPDEMDELVALKEVFQSYLLEVKSGYRRPLGDNRDFVEILSGGNPAGLVFLPPGHPRISDEGRLVDRRGVPFVIHPLSSSSLEIRAAGEDRKVWTEDDLVLAPQTKSRRRR